MLRLRHPVALLLIAALALLAAMRSTLEGGRIALGELPASLLCRSAVAEQVPETQHVTVGPTLTGLVLHGLEGQVVCRTYDE